MVLKQVSALLLLVGFLAACAPTGPKPAEEELGTIPVGSSVSLNVVDAKAAGETPRTEALRGKLFETLVNDGIFAQVLPVGSQADFNMVVLVGTVDEVTHGVGSGSGAAAGANELAAGVALTDTGTNTVVKQFNVTAGSASVPLTSDSGLAAAVTQAASKISAALQD